MANLIADYVVVGGGLAGCVIASRLSQKDKDVILLEAGPDPTGNPATEFFLSGLSLQGGELDYAYPSEPVATTANRVHYLSAGKGLGGETVINFGGWLRGDAADYDEWAEVAGDKRWSYEGLKPWFVKSETFYDSGADPQEHGFEGPMYVISIAAAEEGQRKYPLRETVKNAWAKLGVPHNRDRKNGASVGLNEMHENCSKTGRRQPSYVAYPLDHVKVFTNTPVYREVIVSAGAYQTPKILILSGIGPSADLAEHGIPLVHESSHVGQNLHDHYAIHLAFRLRDPSLGYAFGSAGFQNPAFMKGLSHIATSTMLLLPTSRGTVTIRSSSPTDLPRVRPNYLSTQLDRDTLVHAARTTVKVPTATENMKPIVEGESPPIKEGLEGLTPLTVDTSGEVILERLQQTGEQHQHSGGTAAMGKVVDGEGKVLGVTGLRVADASIIPVPLGGHPQASLYAMAEQLASMILADS
ncbi:GMC oxidoreductase [Hypoxylon sp. FL0890]|nr:GMC oxidoreductase [Hypoxylon sp. FL0890]